MTKLDDCTDEEIDEIVKSERFDTAIKILEGERVEICLKNGTGFHGWLGEARTDVLILNEGKALMFVRKAEVVMIMAPEWFDDHVKTESDDVGVV